ncbi:MAG: flagellar hook-associated protein FlgK [Syntrophales bacterium]|nr:flagellar hook-associated protein FlgK [Syntrophales bacterium]
MSISTILNVTRNALFANQLAIDVTGGNIANVNTEGYSRQVPVFTATGNVQAGAASAQLSVEITKIQRMFDSFTELQSAQQIQRLGYCEARNDILKKVETVFNEVSGGKLSDALNEFWRAWSDLASNPTGQVERHAIIAISQSLADQFNFFADQIYNIQVSIDNTIKDVISEINNLTSEIAYLNTRIGQISGESGEANRLLDERSKLLLKLSELLDCHYIVDENNALNIYLPDGEAIVDGVTNYDLRLVKNSSSTFHDVYLSNANQTVLNSFLTRGERGRLGGLIMVRDDKLEDYRDKLDEMVKGFMKSVNEIHVSGYDQYGNPGICFFVLRTSGSESYARDIMLNPEIVGDRGKIVASSTVNGNGEKAGEVAALKDKLIMSNGIETIGSYYASFIGEIARDISQAARSVDYHRTVYEQLKQQKESIAGVSLDEEMINLVKFQLAYRAAGKLCQTANDLMENLLELVK